MRILITNNHLGDLGGTETWVMTMARELAKEHEVGVWTGHKGYVAELLAEYIDDNPEDYDLALVNHHTCINKAKEAAKVTIFTSHGTEPDLEIPKKGCDYYVAVTENVSKYHNIPHIIKNPIDTERFKPTNPIHDKIEKILCITQDRIPIESLHTTLYPSRQQDNIDELINQCDVVVSMGRGALEAMSCARNVITWDNRPYWQPRGDGYIQLPIKGNVAGEYSLRSIDWKKELGKYNKNHGKRNREYILKHHDVRKIVKEYLDIWTTIKKDI